MKKSHSFFHERRILDKHAHRRTLRLTTFFKFIKTLLPLSAAVAFVTIFAWPHMESYFAVKAEETTAALTMPAIEMTNKLINPRLNISDAHGRSIVLQATSAIQSSTQSAQMTQPHSKLQLDDHHHVHVDAALGNFDHEQQCLDYQNDVVLKSDNGMCFMTQQATMDLKTNQVSGSQPIIGEGPLGKLAAESFAIKENGNTIYLHGKSKLVIN